MSSFKYELQEGNFFHLLNLDMHWPLPGTGTAASQQEIVQDMPY